MLAHIDLGLQLDDCHSESPEMEESAPFLDMGFVVSLDVFEFVTAVQLELVALAQLYADDAAAIHVVALSWVVPAQCHYFRVLLFH